MARKLSRCLVAGAGTGEVDVVIQDPTGQKGTVETQLEARGDSTYRCSYQPTTEGVHTVHVTFAGVPIPRSPYTVTVGQGRPVPAAPRARHCRLGLPPEGVARASLPVGPAPAPWVSVLPLSGLSVLPCWGPSSSFSVSLSTLSPSEELAPAV